MAIVRQGSEWSSCSTAVLSGGRSRPPRGRTGRRRIGRGTTHQSEYLEGALRCREPARTLLAGHDQVAAVAEHLEIREMIRAGDRAVGADQRLDVVHLETELVAEIPSARSRVVPDLRRLEAAPFARPSRSTSRRSTSREPDMVPFELAGVEIAAIGRATRRQGRSAALDAAERPGEVDTRHVRLPSRRLAHHLGRGVAAQDGQQRQLPGLSWPQLMQVSTREAYVVAAPGSIAVRSHESTCSRPATERSGQARS